MGSHQPLQLRRCREDPQPAVRDDLLEARGEGARLLADAVVHVVASHEVDVVSAVLVGHR